jgi:hypothetical protein
MVTPVGSFNERTLIPGIVITVAAFLAGVFFFLNNDGRKISVKVFILYTLATVLLFAAMGFTGLITIEDPLKYFIGTQVGMLALGILHAVVFSAVRGRGDEEYFWSDLIFTTYVTMLGAFIYIFIRARVSDGNYYNLYLLSSFILFLVPFILGKTYDYLYAIPEEEYEKWFFPIDKDFESELDDEDFDDKKTIIVPIQIIGLTTKDENVIGGEILAPLKFEFGHWLAIYFLQRNDRFPGEQIEYLDQYGQPQGWIFYVKPKWYQSRRYLDAKLTIADNELTGKETIVCERA